MQFEVVKDILLSDTLVPDIFLSDIMPRLPSDAVKVYLYCIFLSKYKKEARPEDLAAKLGLSADTVNAIFQLLEREGLILRTPNLISLTDIKENELNRIYKRKTTSDGDAAVSQTAINIKRNQCIDSINKMFFQGLMAPSWYNAIDQWFTTYHFDEDVMVSLFKTCYDSNALNIGYIEKVGRTWSLKGITNHWELEKYMETYEQTKTIGKTILQKLRLRRPLQAYEEDQIGVWLNDYGYDIAMIEEALKLTVGKSNPFKSAHTILTNWNKDGIKNIEQLKAYLEASAQKPDKREPAYGKVPRRDNFQQRQYDDDFYDKLDQSSILSRNKKG